MAMETSTKILLMFISVAFIFLIFFISYTPAIFSAVQNFLSEAKLQNLGESFSTNVELFPQVFTEDMSTIDKIGNFTAKFNPYRYQRYEIPGYQAPVDYGYGYFLFNFSQGEHYSAADIAERVKIALVQWYANNMSAAKEKPEVKDCYGNGCIRYDDLDLVANDCGASDKNCKYCKKGYMKYENGYCYYSQSLSYIAACLGGYFGECKCLGACSSGWTVVPGNLNCICCPESTLYYDEQGASDAPYGKCYYIKGLSFDVNDADRCSYNDFNTGGGKVANITIQSKTYDISTNLTMFIKLNGTYEYGFVPHIIICDSKSVG